MKTFFSRAASLVTLVTLLGVAGVAASRAGEISHWSAASGLLPNQLTSDWTMIDTAPLHDPVLSGGHMGLATQAKWETMYFEQFNGLHFGSSLTIEFRARFGSRVDSADSYSPAFVYFAFGSGLGSVLYLGEDDVWLANGNVVRGPGAGVDTDDAFHTYRLEIGGLTAGSPINVYYDNSPSPLFGGVVFQNNEFNGPSQRLGFGDGTHGDSGYSEWEYLWHNASCVPVGTIPEPSSAALFAAGMLAIAGWRRRMAAR
jgi:hypothetical protein